jgi:hypothetical protein
LDKGIISNKKTMGCMPSRARDGHAGPEMPSSAISGSNQAQSKRELHMFHDIIAQDHEKTAMADELQKQVYKGIYLAGKTKVSMYENLRSN